MKKTLILSQIILIVLFCANAGIAQKKGKPFSGTVTYSISYPDTKMDAAMLATQPKETKVVVLGNKSKSEMVIQDMIYITQILNGDNKTTITMMDAGGQKIYYKMSEEEIKAQNAEEGEPETQFVEETKTIAGYTCKKAIVKLKDSFDETYTVTVFYSPELAGKEINFDGSLRDIPGLPLYYEIKQGEQIIAFEAKEIKKGKFKDKDFFVPSDFRELTPEEKQQLMDAFKGSGE